MKAFSFKTICFLLALLLIVGCAIAEPQWYCGDNNEPCEPELCSNECTLPNPPVCKDLDVAEDPDNPVVCTDPSPQCDCQVIAVDPLACDETLSANATIEFKCTITVGETTIDAPTADFCDDFQPVMLCLRSCTTGDFSQHCSCEGFVPDLYYYAQHATHTYTDEPHDYTGIGITDQPCAAEWYCDDEVCAEELTIFDFADVTLTCRRGGTAIVDNSVCGPITMAAPACIQSELLAEGSPFEPTTLALADLVQCEEPQDLCATAVENNQHVAQMTAVFVFDPAADVAEQVTIQAESTPDNEDFVCSRKCEADPCGSKNDSFSCTDDEVKVTYTEVTACYVNDDVIPTCTIPEPSKEKIVPVESCTPTIQCKDGDDQTIPCPLKPDACDDAGDFILYSCSYTPTDPDATDTLDFHYKEDMCGEEFFEDVCTPAPQVLCVPKEGLQEYDQAVPCESIVIPPHCVAKQLDAFVNVVCTQSLEIVDDELCPTIEDVRTQLTTPAPVDECETTYTKCFDADDNEVECSCENAGCAPLRGTCTVTHPESNLQDDDVDCEYTCECSILCQDYISGEDVPTTPSVDGIVVDDYPCGELPATRSEDDPTCSAFTRLRTLHCLRQFGDDSIIVDGKCTDENDSIELEKEIEVNTDCTTDWVCTKSIVNPEDPADEEIQYVPCDSLCDADNKCSPIESPSQQCVYFIDDAMVPTESTTDDADACKDIPQVSLTCECDTYCAPYDTDADTDADKYTLCTEEPQWTLPTLCAAPARREVKCRTKTEELIECPEPRLPTATFLLEDFDYTNLCQIDFFCVSDLQTEPQLCDSEDDASFPSTEDRTCGETYTREVSAMIGDLPVQDVLDAINATTDVSEDEITQHLTFIDYENAVHPTDEYLHNCSGVFAFPHGTPEEELDIQKATFCQKQGEEEDAPNTCDEVGYPTACPACQGLTADVSRVLYCLGESQEFTLIDPENPVCNDEPVDLVFTKQCTGAATCAASFYCGSTDQSDEEIVEDPSSAECTKESEFGFSDDCFEDEEATTPSYCLERGINRRKVVCIVTSEDGTPYPDDFVVGDICADAIAEEDSPQATRPCSIATKCDCSSTEHPENDGFNCDVTPTLTNFKIQVDGNDVTSVELNSVVTISFDYTGNSYNRVVLFNEPFPQYLSPVPFTIDNKPVDYVLASIGSVDIHVDPEIFVVGDNNLLITLAGAPSYTLELPVAIVEDFATTCAKLGCYAPHVVDGTPCIVNDDDEVVCNCNPSDGYDDAICFASSLCTEENASRPEDQQCNVEHGTLPPLLGDAAAEEEQCAEQCLCHEHYDPSTGCNTCLASSVCNTLNGVPTKDAQCGCSRCYQNAAGYSCTECVVYFQSTFGVNSIDSTSGLVSYVQATLDNSPNAAEHVYNLTPIFAHWFNHYVSFFAQKFDYPVDKFSIYSLNLVAGDSPAVVMIIRISGACDSASSFVLAQDAKISDVYVPYEALDAAALNDFKENLHYRSLFIGTTSYALSDLAAPGCASSCPSKVDNSFLPQEEIDCAENPSHPTCVDPVDPVEEDSDDDDKTWLWILIGCIAGVVVVIIIVVVVAMCCCKKGNNDTVDDVAHLELM